MTTLRKQFLIGLLAIGMGAGSLAAHAENGGNEGKGPRHERGGHHGRMHTPEQMKERFEKRQSELHDKLKLNAQQEQAWNSYLKVVRPAQPHARPDRAELDKLSAPERLEKMYGLMQERQQRMAARIAATREFYAVLSPEQKKVFDAEFMRGPHHRRHHG